jgi:two-component system LytT family response regulator
MSLRYAVIEDEPPARELLKMLVQELQPGAHCLAEAEDGVQGLELLRNPKLDLLFLDIEFPPEGAFGMLRRAQEAGLRLPPIVFVTAYDRYAVEAFRWAACDYLLKPVEPSQLKEALGRIPGHPELDLSGLLATLQALKEPRLPERFTVQAKGRLRVLAWKDVSHLRTENRLLFVHTPEGRFVLDRNLDELEPLLTPEFIRPHRSALVALRDIQELEAPPGEPGELRLRDGSRIPVSRERLPEVRRRLGAG